MDAARWNISIAARGAALLLLFSALGARADSARVWSWHQFGKEIHSPVFSPDGRQIAFSLQRVELTGQDVRNLSPSQLTEHIDDQREDLADNARVFDPVVTLLTFSTSQTERIGYGYEPAFSPDGSSVVFQHQKAPLAGRKREAALAGNEIWLYDRATRNSRMLAAPGARWFAQPKFAPGGEFVIFTIGDVVSGPQSGVWTPSVSGPLGVGRVAVATGVVTTLYDPQPVESLPHLVNGLGFVSGKPYALVTTAEEPPNLKSSRYVTRLVALDGSKSSLHEWRGRDVSAPRAAFGTWRDGRVAVFDSVWQPVGEGESVTAAPGTTRGWRSTPGVLSPDGRKIAREFASGIVISDTVTGRQIAEFPGPMSQDQGWRRGAEQKAGESLAGITWSPDSRRIAWVEKVGLVTQDFATLRVGSL